MHRLAERRTAAAPVRPGAHRAHRTNTRTGRTSAIPAASKTVRRHRREAAALHGVTDTEAPAPARTSASAAGTVFRRPPMRKAASGCQTATSADLRRCVRRRSASPSGGRKSLSVSVCGSPNGSCVSVSVLATTCPVKPFSRSHGSAPV